MYEFEQINPKITKQYVEAMHCMLKSENPYPIIFSVVKKAFKSLVPNMADRIARPYVQNVLTPLYELLKNKYDLRKFKTIEEAESIYYQTEIVFREKAIDSKEVDDLADLFYELLEYDVCLEENGELYLHSYASLVHVAISHINAIRKWNKLYKKKPNEENFDIALNTNTTREKMIAFKLNAIKLDLLHNDVFDRASLLEQKEILLDFIKFNHITARCIAELKKYNHNLPHDNVILSHLQLSHIINADRPIDKFLIYKSFFATVVGIYKRSCAINQKDVPYTKLYKLARKLTAFVFPELKVLKKPLFTASKIKKPIKEIAIFNGLRLISFEDKRYKIHKEKDEIDLTEQYLKNIIKFSKKFTTPLSKS